MIYTLGCSFTKWHWLTWADWLERYLNVPVHNLAGSGFTNALIYQQLLNRRSSLEQQDQIYIMWTGSNRHCVWYDREYIDQKDCQGFFPDTNGVLWYGTDDYRGLYKTHPDHLPSFTHMIVEQFDTVFKTQLLLDHIGCDYRMMFWRNPWSDVRENWYPRYDCTWKDKKFLSKSEIGEADSMISMPSVRSLLDAIDWSKFVMPPNNVVDPLAYAGLWEYTLGNRELVLASHNVDRHPSALAHHDWVVDQILYDVPPLHRTEAKRLSYEWQHRQIPMHDRSAEILSVTP